jgi:hypothetical protein
MDILGLIVSFIALFFALFTYIKHDIKLKKQSEQINKYQLEKINVEKEEKLKAIIEADAIDSGKGNKLIKVLNKGKAIAKDVKVIVPELSGCSIREYPSSMDLKPQQGIDILLFLFAGHPDTITIEFKWSDDFKNDNQDSQTIQL